MESALSSYPSSFEECCFFQEDSEWLIQFQLFQKLITQLSTKIYDLHEDDRKFHLIQLSLKFENHLIN